MINNFSRTAMVLAAGLGTRMRPLTLTKPKPLHVVAGHTMLDHALDKLAAIGVRRVVVNTHYLPDQIESHLSKRKDLEIIISFEEVLLDTAGGIVKALPYFDGLPFFSLNADLPWLDKGEPSLQRMKDMWLPEKMDALLLLMRTEKARGFTASGDFALEADGRVWRKNLATPRPYVWVSAQLLKPELFISPPSPIFSNNIIWDKSEERGRLFGLEHEGTCYHVGTPEDWRTANDLWQSGKGWGM